MGNDSSIYKAICLAANRGWNWSSWNSVSYTHLDVYKRQVVGWASLVCAICFMGGIQLICLGVLGEYIGKIYMEVKHRPRYIISERTFEKDKIEE